ncbi:NADH-quinone oxidoreductase subunit C [Acidiphilium sp.]|uniref:NADH-quinone oxidoreductase subunit D-related protein n=1 Tax=Acidiphilium sp. TaxID=527 RepID=UPI00258BB8F0|nr:NADH-quinone oxidoreductase subunit C [Acidiphilium sp.]
MNGTETATVPCERMPDIARGLFADGGRMQMVYAWHPEPEVIELRYLASPPESRRFLLWRCRPEGDPPSLARIWPSLGWYEREIMDLFGIAFANHPEPNRLVLSEDIAPPFNGAAPARPPRMGDIPRPLPEIEAPEVQILPFGPVRADVLESAEFTFFYIGEQIIHYHPHLFFKHRGMESRFAGLPPRLGAVWAERVSGVGSVAHALAYCQAVEAASSCTVPKRALALRVLLAELERVYNHLHYLGHLANTTTLKVGEAQGKLLEEHAKQINARLTGSRFLRGLLVPGGLRRDLAPGEWLSPAIEELREETARYVALLERSDSHLDRLITTGRLPSRIALDQGATGPVQRASGIDRDLRRDHPYAAYADLPLVVPVRSEGDAYARSAVRAVEIDAAIVMMQRVLLLLEDGPVCADCTPAPGAEGLGWAESPRGTLFYAVHIGADGRLARVKIKSPSYSNWRVFPFTVHETNMMDYAINEASFGLTIAGCAR